MSRAPDLALGIDVGTGTTKVVLADSRGEILWQASSSYQYQSPRPEYAEQDPEDWWRALGLATRTLFREHPGAEQRIAAVAVSGQGVGAVLLDAQARVLRPAILWLDRRCADDAEQLQISHGERIVSISGKLPASYNVEPKLRWIRRHEPEIWSRCWKAFTTTAFVTYRLTGSAVMNHSDGGILLGYDLARGRWSNELLGLMDLPASVYCELAASDAVIGKITEDAAAHTGIPQGVPVVAGGEDTSSAGLAMGVLTSDTGQLSLGTANTVNVPMRHPVIHPQLLAFPHVLRDWTLIGGSLSSGGLATQWIGKILSGTSTAISREAVNDLMGEASTISPGADGLIFLPYLAGELQPINDGYARGVFFGLNAEMGRAHLIRAVLEGNALAIEHNLSLAKTVNAAPQCLVAVGGPTRNTLLCQIIADVTALPVRVMDESAGAALGSAILAAQGAQLISSVESMQAAHAKQRQIYRPDPERHSAYQKVFKTYIELYPRLKDLYPRSGSAREAGDRVNADVHI
ncbi:MAG: FGGY family carbohydrate kinase [Terriglobales bacterium]